jgi:asparagine synthase (glutamine-hydrolysing)
MTDRLRHRGPDEEGAFVDATVGLGSRRLRVIDLATGRMPIANETGTIRVVYNGEVYNYRSLREELIGRGHVFQTRTDTEVLVHLYEESGTGVVERLVGMFSFVLARDRLGIKPLYYRLAGGILYFGSELKSLLAVSGEHPAMDQDELAEYLALGYIRAPRTIYAGYRKLQPGSILTFQRGALRTWRYWNFPTAVGEEFPDPQAAIEALDEALRVAVVDRLVADVPLGFFLSGGVDSSLIVAIAAEHVSGRIKTFSVGFEGQHELDYARRVAEHFDTDHHELVLEPASCGIIDQLIGFYDEPFGDSSSVPTYYVSQLARQHVTVALSGDGGDELFGGYDQYAHDLRWAWTDRLPRVLRRAIFGIPARILPPGMYGWQLLHDLSGTRENRFARYVTQELDGSRGGLLREELSRGLTEPAQFFRDGIKNVAHLPFPARLLYLDATNYLPDDILTKVDRMSMAHSLETRIPLLDHRLVELAARLPVKWKLRNGDRKWILKQLARRYLPLDVLRRPKQGFSIPIREWLRGEQRELVELVAHPDALSATYLHRDTIERLIGEHHRGRRDHGHVLWRLMVFELWLRRVSGESEAGLMTDWGAGGGGSDGAHVRALGDRVDSSRAHNP